MNCCGLINLETNTLCPSHATLSSLQVLILFPATVCPVTKTTTEKGTTKVYTDYSTSTIVVTSCPGGDCGGAVTVPGPTAYTTTTDVE